MNNKNPSSEPIKFEQQQELFEAIRHFSKYKALGNLDKTIVYPKVVDSIQENLIKLYEQEYKE